MDWCFLYYKPHEILQGKNMVLLAQSHLAAIRHCCTIWVTTLSTHRFCQAIAPQGLPLLVILCWCLIPTMLSEIDLLPSIIWLLKAILQRLRFLKRLCIKIRHHINTKTVLNVNLTCPILWTLRPGLGRICDMDSVFFQSLSNLKFLDIAHPLLQKNTHSAHFLTSRIIAVLPFAARLSNALYCYPDCVYGHQLSLSNILMLPY
jgi:hypothetical protein